MRELKPKCALRESFSISFGLLWPRGATTTNVDWTAVYREREREREQREGKGTLAACLHFRFFTPRLGFDCGLLWFKAAAGGSRQPVHVLGTWYTTRERSRERKGEEEEKSTCLAIVDSHSLLLLAAAGSLSNANCLGLLSSPNLALAFQIVWPRICRDLLMIRCGTVRVLQVEVGSGPSRGLAWPGQVLACRLNATRSCRHRRRRCHLWPRKASKGSAHVNHDFSFSYDFNSNWESSSISACLPACKAISSHWFE